MANVINVIVDNPDELLTSGMYDAGAIIRLQSSATEGGAYTNESTAALVAGTTAYVLYDSDGASTTWYRTRYENAGGTSYSDWSDPFQVGEYLCSLYDVKERLGISQSNTSNDNQLVELIREVTVEIERVTGRDFTGDKQDTVNVFDVKATASWLWIDRGIQSITTLEIATETGGSYTTFTGSYFLRPIERSWLGQPANRVLLHDSLFYAGYETARITGKLGWASVPADIDRIAQTAVVAKWLTKGTEGPRVVVGPSGQATILRDISPADWQTLMDYAVVVV